MQRFQTIRKPADWLRADHTPTHASKKFGNRPNASARDGFCSVSAAPSTGAGAIVPIIPFFQAVSAFISAMRHAKR